LFSTPTRRPLPIAPLSPAPAEGSEIRAFLTDLASSSGIDITDMEHELVELDFTPDVIPDVAVVRLQEVLNITEGKVIKAQSFARKWSARLEQKRNDSAL
jgi:hypothetical protein